MAEIEIGAKLTLDQKEAIASVRAFKMQIKAAEADVLLMAAKFGDVSKEAAAAAKKVAGLKDAIGDAKQLSDTFNPDKKFVALGGAMQGVLAGFSAYSGAMGLLGADSAEVQKLLLKVQSAMALQQGISGIFGAVDSFKLLGKSIASATIFQKIFSAGTVLAAMVQKAFAGAVGTTSVAFKVLRGAIISTGIGALVVLIGVVISKIVDWVGSNESLEKSQERLKLALDASTASMNRNREAASRASNEAVALAKSQGKSAAEIFKIQQDAAIADEVKLDQEYVRRYDAYQKNKELNNRGLIDDEKLKEFKDAAFAANSAVEDSKSKRKIDQLNEDDRIREAGIVAGKKGQEENKKISDKEKAAADEIANLKKANILSSIKDEDERQKTEIRQKFAADKAKFIALGLSQELEDAYIIELKKAKDIAISAVDIKSKKDQEDRDKAANETLKKTQEENTLNAITDVNVRAKAKAQFDYDNRVLEIAELKVHEDIKTKLLSEALITRDATITGVNATIATTQAQKIVTDTMLLLENEKLTIAERVAIVANGEKQIKDLKGLSEHEVTEAAKGFSKARITIAKTEAEQKTQMLQQSAQALTAMADIVGKETVAGKALAVAGALINTYQGIAAGVKLGYPLAIPAVILAAATGFAAVKNILKVKVPGKGGGGGGSVPATPTAQSLAAPLTPQVQTTTLNQGQLNQIGNATVRAYVTETDITNNQQRIRALNRAARI